MMASVHPDPLQAWEAGDTGRLHRLVADSIPQLVWATAPDGGADYFNLRLLAYTGLSADQLAGQRWREIIHADDRERVFVAWNEASRAGERYTIECRLRRADGAYRWHHVSALPLRGSDGSVVRWFGTCTEIEDQVRNARQLESTVEERTRALRESEQRFRTFMEHAPAVAWIKDASFRYTYVNRAFERYHDRPAKELLGHDDFELFPTDVARYFRTDDEAVVKSREAVQKLRQFPYASGGLAHWLVVKFPFGDASGATGLAGIAIDVTARVEAEEKALRYAGDVRNLVNRLVQAQEAERRRVANELHDLIGQNLTALGIDLQALKQRLQSAGDQIAAPRLDAMAALVETTIDAIRGVMTDLRPVALEEFGLVPALRWYASQFSKRTGIKVATKAPRRETRLPPDIELALFRIVQEALTNAAKHSGGTSVEIRIRYGERVKLTVQDDGRGFSEPVGARAARRGGFGLTTMRERAEAHGGSLRVEFPGGGTRLVVEIPVAGHVD
jgi:PAS domain S-box-containing protein